MLEQNAQPFHNLRFPNGNLSATLELLEEVFVW